MEKIPIDIEGCEGWYCSNIKLSQRLKWHDDSKKNPYDTIPSLLSMSVVDAEGKPVMSTEQWDEWAGESNERVKISTEVFDKCMDIIGRVEGAKKN